MASINNPNDNIFNISDNIIISIDDNNMADMYVYDDHNQYVLNGYTASDLVTFFAYNDDVDLSEEILDIVMDITVHIGTH